MTARRPARSRFLFLPATGDTCDQGGQHHGSHLAEKDASIFRADMGSLDDRVELFRRHGIEHRDFGRIEFQADRRTGTGAVLQEQGANCTRPRTPSSTEPQVLAVYP